MAGVELRHCDGSPATTVAMQAIKTMLHCGYVLLPEDEHSNVISFTPPLTISEAQLAETVEALAAELESVAAEVTRQARAVNGLNSASLRRRLRNRP